MERERQECIRRCHARYDDKLKFCQNEYGTNLPLSNPNSKKFDDVMREARAELDRCLAGCAAYR
jgi:hypothetical protein